MSKSLKSMLTAVRDKAIDRRLKEKKGGNGYWAAVDADKKRKGGKS